MERADRSAESQKNSAQAAPASPLAGQRGFPAGVHVGCQRQQGLLRTGAPGPLPARVRESAMTRSLQATGLAASLSPSVREAERRQLSCPVAVREIAMNRSIA